MILTALCLAFTVGNFLAHRYGEAKRVKKISTLAIGQPLPRLILWPVSLGGTTVADGPLATGCRVIVAFDPTCAHCGIAAQRDKSVPDSVRLPVIWVSASDDSDAAAFASYLDKASVLRYGGKAALEQLQAHGVPAAFLVSASDRVIWTGGYAGGESNHAALRKMCSD
jgi:hypothetical protein